MSVQRLTIPDRATWLQWRKPLLTASDIGAAAGLDEYKGPLDLHLEKAGLRAPAGETALMRRGRLFEAAAIAYLQEELPGWRVLRPNIFLRDEERRLGATPDLLVEDPDEPGQLINCQIKIVGKPAFEKWNGQPPMSYMLQTACENMLLGADSGMLAVLVVSAFDAELEMFSVPRHAEAEARIERIAADFWDRVDNNRMPVPDYKHDAEIVKELYPPNANVETPLDLTSDNRIYELLEERERHKAAEKAAVAECEAIDAELVDKLRGATLALAEGWKITRKMQHRDQYTVPAKDYPVLRVTRTKEAA